MSDELPPRFTTASLVLLFVCSVCQLLVHITEIRISYNGRCVIE